LRTWQGFLTNSQKKDAVAAHSVAMFDPKKAADSDGVKVGGSSDYAPACYMHAKMDRSALPIRRHVGDVLRRSSPRRGSPLVEEQQQQQQGDASPK
jgi:hypothetical protein